MSEPLPTYDAPPVVETVLAVQFARLDLSNALAGWYWKQYLGKQWPKSAVAPRLDDAFERFGDERTWGTPSLRFTPGLEAPRLQVFREDNQRLVQIQDTKFIYNWKKLPGEPYPTYKKLLPEFEQHLEHFEKFISDENLGEVNRNQWEVVYVNFIPKGDMWQTAADWESIFPAFKNPVDHLELDSVSSTWQYVIGKNLGRLRIELRHAKTQDDDKPQEVIRLQLAARGPITEKVTLRAGCDLGHETIVRAFTKMTSSEAHKGWKRLT